MKPKTNILAVSLESSIKCNINRSRLEILHEYAIFI